MRGGQVVTEWDVVALRLGWRGAERRVQSEQVRPSQVVRAGAAPGHLSSGESLHP